MHVNQSGRSAEDFFKIVRNAGAQIGLSRFGMLASRPSVVQILDGYEDVLYSMVVHADSIQPGHLGSFAFFL